jgi:hypothetical protein
MSVKEGESKAAEIYAPKGTFEFLASLPPKLGNTYTKRLVKITTLKDELGLVCVSIRIREQRGGLWFRTYSLGVNTSDRVINFTAKRFQMAPDTQEQPIDNPSLVEVLREIKTASRIQPTLKGQKGSDLA